MLESDELKSIALSTGLILLNIVVIAVFAFTPLAKVSKTVFSVPIIGIIFFGALLTGGNYLAKRGIRNDRTGTASAGAAVLQFTYGLFGAGALSLLEPGAYAAVLGITAVITTGIALLAALLVYGTDHNFRKWGMYSNYLFGGVFLFGLLGSLGALSPLLVLAFFLALAGFIVYLVYEIWDMKQRPARVMMNGLGIYVAYMGVFVEILRIVVAYYMEE
ncbi:MAG: hypothetical protein ABEJ75_04435 [Candidatus Nanohaloarchaea archaeon]